MNKDKLPKGYQENVPRVSDIVEFYYPFAGDKQEGFLSWLYKYGVSYESYMKEASTGGTYVHKKMQEYIDTGTTKIGKYKKIVANGIEFLSTIKTITDLHTEVYVNEGRYQGMGDVVDYRNYIILDWKTWGLAKKKFGIPQSEETYRKPYEKIKKARLQLSLYAYGIDKDNYEKYSLIVCELNEFGYKLHHMDIIPREELAVYINNFLYENLGARS